MASMYQSNTPTTPTTPMTPMTPASTPTFALDQDGSGKQTSHRLSWKNRKKIAKNFRSVSFFSRKKNTSRPIAIGGHVTTNGFLHRNSIDSSNVFDSKANSANKTAESPIKQSSFKQLKAKTKKKMFSPTESRDFKFPSSLPLVTTPILMKSSRKNGDYIY